MQNMSNEIHKIQEQITMVLLFNIFRFKGDYNFHDDFLLGSRICRPPPSDDIIYDQVLLRTVVLTKCDVTFTELCHNRGERCPSIDLLLVHLWKLTYILLCSQHSIVTLQISRTKDALSSCIQG